MLSGIIAFMTNLVSILLVKLFWGALNNELKTDSQIMLSVREQEILELIASKFSNKEIGSRLFISEATVKRHITNILKKLQTTNRNKAVAQALKLGILVN